VTWSANSEPDFKEYDLDFSSYSATEGWQDAVTTTSLLYYQSNVYYYKIRGVDNGNHSSIWSSTVSAAPEAVLPDAPENFTGVAQSTYSILWSWDDLSNETAYRVKYSTDTGTTLETAYRVKYSTDTGTTLAELSEDDTNWLEENLTANSSYYRVVLGTNSVGEGALSSAATTWTLAYAPESISVVSVGTFTVELSWVDDNNPSWTRYGLSKSTNDFATNISTFIAFSNALTAKTTVAYGLTPDTTYWFRVWAYNEDARETNYVTSGSTKTYDEIPTLDVVINEIAWMGTAAAGVDEWIELYNNTGGNVNLADWTLNAKDGTPSIDLSDTINANDYYLLERTDNTTVSDIVADKTYTGDMGDAGDHLELRDGDGNLIDEIDCSSGWFAGTNDPDYTMERKDATVSGNDSNNWAANDGVTKNGLDADSNPLNGTPTQLNSVISDIIAPGPVTTLSALLGTNQRDVNLTWLSPGDDGTEKTIITGKFKIEYSSWTDTIWSTNTETGDGYYITLDTSSVAPLSSQSHTITGLTGDTTYYFRIWTADEVPNWGALSNAATCYVTGIFGVDIQTITIPMSYYEAGGSTIGGNGNSRNAVGDFRYAGSG